MNHKILEIALSILFLLGMFVINGCGQEQETKSGVSSQAMVIDDFDRPHTGQYNWLHRPRFVSFGYGVYYDRAKVNLSKVAVSEADSALRIEYELPPVHDWATGSPFAANTTQCWI